MKKIFYTLTVMLALTGCCSSSEGQVTEMTQLEDNGTLILVKDKDNWTVVSMYAYDFEYRGHEYIVFRGSERMGVVHSPDCPCHNNTTVPVSTKTETSDYPDWW